MEAVPALPDDNSGANPSSVKSDGSSPRTDGGRGSPPPNCAICLGTCRNKSFTDSCLHQFCFKCLLTWSKVKAECPLCKQNFKSIIHNVRSNHQYEEYMVEQQQAEEVTERADDDNLRTVTRRFRYSTTFTLPRHETIAIQQLLMHYPLMAGVLPPPRRRRSPASFRRTVYRHNLWARPLPDFTGRFRDATPLFYRYNDTQMHRLVPWLNRELSYLLNDNVGHISYVLARILELLPRCTITSLEFRDAMRRYFGDRTEHFLHELYCFASTPYDMTGYDRNVQYTTDSRISTMVNEVISSSESEASVDSDIVMVSSSEPAEVPPGPSGVPPPAADNVIPIETISHSDTDDDSSEVMVVGYIKPPQDRTPEVVDLVGSDSDVIVQEGARPEPQTATEPAEGRPAPVVKLTLKRQRAADQSNSDDSDDSDDSTYRPPAARRRRRARSRDSATTADTRAPTPDTPRTPDAPHTPHTPHTSHTSHTSLSPHTPHSPHASHSDAPARRASASSLSACYSSSSSDGGKEFSDDDSDSDGRRTRFVRRKSKKKSCRDASAPRRERKRAERRSSRSRRTDRKPAQDSRADREKRSKRKSHSGKGVKSSKRRDDAAPERASDKTMEYAEAGPSGCCERKRRRSTRDTRRRWTSRDSRRLKSVVNVMYGAGATGTTGGSVASSGSGASGASGSSGASGASGASSVSTSASHKASASSSECGSNAARHGSDTDSDSEDNLPLNLTVQKAHPVS